MVSTQVAPAADTVAGVTLYPSRLEVDAAAEFVADLLGHTPELTEFIHHRPTAPGIYRALDEHQLYVLGISPGTCSLRVEYPKQYAKETEPLGRTFRKGGEPGELDEWAQALEDQPSRGRVTEWSKRSRGRMFRRLAELDYSPWNDDPNNLAMVTLTLPGDWLTVAPSGRDFKKAFDRFRKRWTRQVGPWRCIWKLEFQDRGAPHMHLLMKCPPKVGRTGFYKWLSRTWADCVDHPDPDEYLRHRAAGTRVDFEVKNYIDPKRMAVYFLKHASKAADSKEYQHIVPSEWQEPGAGPGRFWGYSGFGRAHVELLLGRTHFVRAKRILRGVARGRAAGIEMQRLRHAGSPVKSLRYVRPRLLRGFNGGWIVTNDGVLLAYQLARALALIDT